jgi:metal-dependent amidase/aminoacylase/carboxypeptidase family protein
LWTFELYDQFRLTDNDRPVSERIADALAEYFDERTTTLTRRAASEDFSDIPAALGVCCTYWRIGGTNPDAHRAAQQAGRIAQDIPVKHAAGFAPVIKPTLDTGTQPLVVAAPAWLAK